MINISQLHQYSACTAPSRSASLCFSRHTSNDLHLWRALSTSSLSSTSFVLFYTLSRIVCVYCLSYDTPLRRLSIACVLLGYGSKWTGWDQVVGWIGWIGLGGHFSTLNPVILLLHGFGMGGILLEIFVRVCVVFMLSFRCISCNICMCTFAYYRYGPRESGREKSVFMDGGLSCHCCSCCVILRLSRLGYRWVGWGRLMKGIAG
ncbi:hypothetical protein VTL71DRAFT_4414 [Oculimacula yallundae]|uniref:Uncharacterized protein n=1 Tax=Oculimacula yallundae TaxID=86028 RepID=A0ABR4C1Z6_9HELO